MLFLKVQIIEIRKEEKNLFFEISQKVSPLDDNTDIKYTYVLVRYT